MASNLKAFKPPDGLKPFDSDKPASEVPSTHLWPSSYVDDHPIECISSPVIDLADVGQKELDQLRHACEEWGFFQVLNHGVSDNIIEDFKEEMIGLFSLPMETKLRGLRGENEAYGYDNFQISRSSPNCMWHEGFTIENQSYKHVVKIWPPNGNPKFCQAIGDYLAAMKTLAEKIMTHMLASLGLTPRDTNWSEPKTDQNPFGPHSSKLALNSYPECPDPSKTMGFVRHTDSSIITLLNQVNNIAGLQILHDNKWVMVEPIPGAFGVNIGDLGHLITNGRFLSVVHRAIPLKGDHRYSAAYNYGPPFEAPLTPLPKLIGPNHSQIYRPTTWEDFRNMRIKYDAKVFEFMRIDRIDNNENIENEEGL